MSLQIYYSCPYVDSINSLESIKNYINLISTKKLNCQLAFFPDTNICVYMRELYANPKQKNIENPTFVQRLRSLIKFICSNEIEFHPIFGIDESSRNVENFALNIEKMNQTILFINNLFLMSDENFHSYISSNISHQLIKSPNKLLNSKRSSLTQESYFQKSFQPLFYLSLIKIYLIIEKENNLSRIQQFKLFFEFLTKDINLINSTLLQLAVHYIGSQNNNIRFMKKIRTSKTINEILHNIFNCSIDLSLPMLISHTANEKNVIPIFITTDQQLSTNFFELTKIHTKLHINNQYTPLTSISFKDTMFSSNDIEEIHSL